MRIRTKTVMDQMNAEKPDDVLADLEAKHGSSAPAGSEDSGISLEDIETAIRVNRKLATALDAKVPRAKWWLFLFGPAEPEALRTAATVCEMFAASAKLLYPPNVEVCDGGRTTSELQP